MTNPLLERREEVSRITTALDEAAAGTGRLVVIEGPPGIGKTRLVEAARALAKERGFGRLLAVGDETERTLPWGVVRQLVERSVIRYSGATRAAILEGPAGAALAALDRASETNDDAGLGRALHALWWVAADLCADRPLLITVDDAQWADTPSLRYLAYLARRLGDLPIALVVGTRPPENDDGPLAELTTGRLGERLLPGPLSAEGVRAMADDTLDAAVAGALHAASGGNPFLAGQLLGELANLGLDPADPGSADAVAELGPRTVSRTLLSRISDDARALASAAAVLGVRSDATAAAALADLDTARASAATDELTRLFLVQGDGSELVFAHPVLRETVLQDLNPTDRAALHAAAARTLHAAGAPAERIAAHLATAPPGTLDDAEEILAAAGRTLLAEGDPVHAVTYFERALTKGKPDHVLLAELGTALLRAGRPDEARHRLREAAKDATSPRQLAERLAAAASATLLVDGPEAAAAELRGVLETFDAGDDPGAALMLEVRLAVMCAYVPQEFERSGERLRNFADLPGDTREERGLLRLVAQRAFSEARPSSEVLDLARRATAPFSAGVAISFEGLQAWGGGLHAAIHADGIDHAIRELEQAKVRLLPGGSPVDYACYSSGWVLLHWRTGNLAQCEAEAHAGIEALGFGDDNPFAAALLAVLTRYAVLVALERGDLPAAETALDGFDAKATTASFTVPMNRLLYSRSALALANDDAALARKYAEGLGAAERSAGSDNPAIGWRLLAAAAAHRLGDEDGARQYADEQLALARQWATSTDLGIALRLAARVGEADARLATLEEAVGVLEQSPARLELAYALCDLGETLRVANRRVDAREPLHRAAELATECGATVLRERALDALARLGDKPRELLAPGAEALTASERRVAELAIGGRSNREIAQEIFVTPKTVENHLGRVYIKLGIRGRKELASALA